MGEKDEVEAGSGLSYFTCERAKKISAPSSREDSSTDQCHPRGFTSGYPAKASRSPLEFPGPASPNEVSRNPTLIDFLPLIPGRFRVMAAYLAIQC